MSQDVEATLRRAGYDVSRLAGGTRFGTAAAIAREIARLRGILQFMGREPTAFLALGTSFEDALAAGPAAASEVEVPILLTARTPPTPVHPCCSPRVRAPSSRSASAR